MNANPMLKDIARAVEGDPPHAAEIRKLCQRASRPQLADGMIDRGLTPQQAQRELFDLMFVARGTMDPDDAVNRPAAAG